MNRFAIAQEPPYLDIGESKEHPKDTARQNADAPADNFDDEEPTNKVDKLCLPAELQSPKMIIEEQMDKVVTKIDPYNKDADSVHTSVMNTEDTSDAMEKLKDATELTNESLELLDEEGRHEDNADTVADREIPNSADEEGATNTVDQALSVSVGDKENKVQMKQGATYRIEMSLCGLSSFGADENENATKFTEHQMTYDKFMHNPNLLNDPRLVFRYENRYYAAGRTGPLFTSLLLFRKPLEDVSRPMEGTDASSKVSDSRESYFFGKGWRQWLSRSSVAAPSQSSSDENDSTATSDTPATAKEESAKGETTTFTTTTMTTSVGWSAEHKHPGEEEAQPLQNVRRNFAKTLRLTSEQLKSLNLNKGVNTISFSVTSAYQGTATCSAKIFYWNYDIQIVISDIDGTITKSDTLGHVFTMIGKDWTHPGVAKLYTDIHNNGYQILYLTSRAIGQADYTRDYLKKVEQNKYQLPDGPVIMSPDRLFTSLHREVIMRKPELFKMACLRDVQRLFGGRDPFYAGFGNRITDAMSYRSVSVPASRIFTIDSNGDVKLELLTGFKSSYIHLNDLVDQIFPPINKAIDEQYNDWNYWKAPIATVDLPELESEPTPTSPKPKPIIPDPSALPAESVAAAADRPHRSILRSFTRSSTTDTGAKKPVAKIQSSSSSSTIHSFSSGRDSPKSEHSFERSDTKESSGDSKSTAAHEKTEETETYSAPPSAPTSRSSSSSIMNKVISGSFGGVRSMLSRSSVSSADAYPIAPSTAESSTESKESQTTEDDDLLGLDDDIDDEIDMDNIPFI
ncbi:Lipin/Ned1/Smp2-domain-containing protein [Radiomyces spectabilis]|uniref:Lipin/Ned1/Smp2-domain-containing protein n=1 Tax=Radiomyces spectabilis TaxID=64574 RepID=UPI002220B78F|nr:Lipin/Ned1/Smp2-domain-containing protein [Radiomyces spectabilis]KAI8364644.1 Lipin/Ned1/Smp2-domain-containing protein [Radiomyces spectabilis]